MARRYEEESTMRIDSRISWIAAPLLALVAAGCADSDKPLGVRESGAGGPSVVVLGTTSTFAVLAQDSINSTGATVITGDVGLTPGTATEVTGFPPGTYSGTLQANNAAAATAAADLLTAITDVTARSTGVITLPSGDLSGLTLSPGLYDTTAPLTLSGTLTLNALGHPEAVFIIRTSADLTTAAGSRVVLTSGAQASNVIWLVGTTATLGANSEFQGTILANQSITLNSGAHLIGRALARTGVVTLNASVITVP
jgi:hypothetical protein